MRVPSGTDKKGVYKTIKVTIDYTSIFHRRKEQKENNSIRLLIPQWADSKE